MKTVKILIVAAVFGSLASCQTVGGFGRDVEKLGENIEDAAGN